MTRNLIATVGSNPLPVVIVARHLKPRKLWLLYTKSTAEVRDRITELLLKTDDKPDILDVEMGEGLTLSKATEQLKSNKTIEWDGANLNYTAGTKQMSVVVHERWQKANQGSNDEADACYLSADGILYWDKGPKDEPQVELSLEEIATLHFDKDSKISNDHEDEHKLALSQKICEVVCDSGIEAYLAALPPVHGKGTVSLGNDAIFVSTYNACNDKNFKNDSPWVKVSWPLPLELGLGESVNWDDISRQVFPEAKVNKTTRVDTFKFLATEWIEIWLAAFLKKTGLFREVAQSFKVDPGGSKEFELDVVALKDSRIYTFSCTIDQSVGLVKHKALEAHHRTQRIGGDHAAFAVFSLSKDPQRVSATIKEERWHGHDRARIFGIEHLRDTDKFRRELEEWLRH